MALFIVMWIVIVALVAKITYEKGHRDGVVDGANLPDEVRKYMAEYQKYQEHKSRKERRTTSSV